MVRRPESETGTKSHQRKCRASATYLAEPCIRQCRVGGWVSNETAGLGRLGAKRPPRSSIYNSPKHKGKETLSVKACCTAPSLNPNMNPQKNKASPKRPQFFLPELLKVALLPGHWCAWNRRCVDPPFSVSGNPGISEPAGPPASSPALQSGVVPGRANVRVTMSSKERQQIGTNSFSDFGPKTLQNCIISNPLNLSPAKSPLRHRSVFGAKSAENSEKCVFRVQRQMCCLGLQIRSFSAENRLQVFAVLRNPFSTPKSLRIPAR